MRERESGVGATDRAVASKHAKKSDAEHGAPSSLHFIQNTTERINAHVSFKLVQ